MVQTASQSLPESALALLERHFGGSARLAPVELVAGSTNLVVRIRLRNDSYAVRVPRSAMAHLEVDRRSECAALELAATADLAPRVVICDPMSGILVTHWIEGGTWTAERAHQPDAILGMARALNDLHALAVPGEVRSLAPQPLLNRYWRIVTSRGSSLQSLLAPIHASVLARAQGAHRAPLVLCHSDLHHRNLIEDRALRLLDWEYAGVTERSYDLASFSQSNDLTPAERELLVRAYGLEREDEPRFELHCVLFDWICVLWLATVDARERTAERNRLETLARRVKSALGSD